jgi:hypothetical protein
MLGKRLLLRLGLVVSVDNDAVRAQRRNADTVVPGIRMLAWVIASLNA